MERAQDVLMHKRLLHMAHDPATRPAVQVRLVQVIYAIQYIFENKIKIKNCTENTHLCRFILLQIQTHQENRMLNVLVMPANGGMVH